MIGSVGMKCATAWFNPRARVILPVSRAGDTCPGTRGVMHTTRIASRGTASRVASCAVALLVAFVAGCGGDSAAPERAVPVLHTEIVVIDSPASTADPDAHATCQTGALLSFRAHNPDGSSYDPAGAALTYAWLFQVDRGEGI